ncbi:efflux transporter outer membrane subunit [Flavobacterium sp. JP2137]|uniref:efflux transporter outer membrane subunit n=1 Tax=Flavobacterium sp. JP2137 TaxID=3414510 RepID=UPI003D2FDD39
MKNENSPFWIYTSLAAMLLLGSACAPQSDYSPPKFDLPSTYRFQDTLGHTPDSVGIADIDWKSFYQDEQLVAWIDQGLKNNFDIQKALKNIEIADQKVRQAKMGWLPSVSLDAGNAAYQYRSENYYGSAASKWYTDRGETAPTNMYVNSAQYISALQVSWEIDIWGKIKNQKAEALARYLQTYEAQKAIQTELISQIAEGYYNLLLLDAQLEVAQANFELSNNTLKIVQLQRDAGQITSLAIQQTRSQMLVAKALIPSLNQQIALQENALMLLMGQLPQGVTRHTKLSDLAYEETLTSGVPLYLVGRRPDVRAAELELKAKNAVVGVSQANRYPSLKIDVSGGLNSMLAENWFNIPGSLFGSLIGTLTQPVFQKRRLKTDFEVAKLERNKSEIDFQYAVYTAINEVTDALITLDLLDKQLEIAEEQVSTAKLGIKQSNLLFNSGFATYLEIINAQRVALDSELNLNKLKQHKLLARVKLYKSLGGGWK